MVSVTLTYASPGARPPIFLAGSFSEPAWDPIEMDYKTAEDGEHHFTKEITAKEGGQFQYKFRIGTGDWWALNEDAPTVTDDSGNRNNLLVVPLATECAKLPASADTEKTLSEAGNDVKATVEADQPNSQYTVAVPELVVEQVDSEPRHENSLGSQVTVGHKDVHETRAKDTEPDHVMTKSGTSTPAHAADAAEVADTAATLDREASPIPVSDEEAGRIGMRRLSSTPIPEVALTAAEVADTASALDQDEPNNEMISLPHLDLDTETPSKITTPWDERVPLFSHECLHSPEHQHHESPPKVQQRDDNSPSSQITEEAMTNYDDPTLEKFPTDRMAVLEQIRSIESRLGVDEVRDDGSHSPVVVSPRNASPSLWSPPSTGLESETLPPLEVISEQARLPERFSAKLPSSIPEVDAKISPQLEVIPEEFQTPEVSLTKPSDSIKNVEQPDSTNAVTVSVAKSMPTPGNEQYDGLIEASEATKNKDSIESGHSAQLEDSDEVHEPTKAAEEPANAKELPELHKITEVKQLTINEIKKKATGSMAAGPLLEHEKLTEADESNGTDGLPKFGESIQIEHPGSNEPLMPGPFLQHTMSTGAEELTNVEHSKMQQENMKTPGAEPDLINIKTLEDKDTNVETYNTSKTEGVSEFDEPNTDVLGQSKVIRSETGDSLEKSQEDELKETVHPQDQPVVEELKQHEHVERTPVMDELGDSQKRVEVSKTENSQMESSEINGTRNFDDLLVRESPENHAKESFAGASPENEVQHVEQDLAAKDIASHIISSTSKADSLATTDSTPPDSVRQYSAGENIAITSAAVDETDKITAPVVEDPHLVEKEDLAGNTEESESNVVTEVIPESAVDEHILAAADDKDLSVNVTHEVVPPITRDDNLPATAAGLGALKLEAEKDLSTTTLDEDGHNIGAEEEVLITTVENDSPPFLVKAAQTDPLEPGKVTPGHSNGIDTAKSTSFEVPQINTGNDSNVKARISSTVERSVTPASVHSAFNRKESSNFFKALWRTVFVEWIGGLFYRLFGGGRSS